MWDQQPLRIFEVLNVNDTFTVSARGGGGWGYFIVLFNVFHTFFKIDASYDKEFVYMGGQLPGWEVNLDNSTSNVLIPLDSWTSGLLEYKLSLSKYSEEEVAKTMAKTMEQYMSKTRADYGSGVARPKIKDKDNFDLKGQFLKELRTNTFSGSDHEDANKHIEKVLEIIDLFHIPNITIDQVMLRAFLMSLTGTASRWLKNEPTGSITTWEGLKTKFLNKYCPRARTTKKMEEINNFKQEPDENLYQAWERFKELLMKCP
ncbi:putative reverse transcriptase domain-containing protein [Tanacetum coccineum]|uniref:Reverse transcriptase domain-containing protein n=1 Tax=Tanacetum coccineum TaxID=301880 RepID=A0ABQ4XLA2_9ASTR